MKTWRFSTFWKLKFLLNLFSLFSNFIKITCLPNHTLPSYHSQPAKWARLSHRSSIRSIRRLGLSDGCRQLAKLTIKPDFAEILKLVFWYVHLLCISTSERMLVHAFAWLKLIENTRKWVKKVPFHHAYKRLMRGLRRKLKKKVCWSAIESDSQSLVGTQTLVAHLEICCFLFFFLHAPLMRTMMFSEKLYYA